MYKNTFKLILFQEDIHLNYVKSFTIPSAPPVATYDLLATTACTASSYFLLWAYKLIILLLLEFHVYTGTS